MNKYNIVVMPEFKKTLRQNLKYYSLFNNMYSLKIIYEINEMAKIIQKFPYVAQILSKDERIRKYIIKNRFSVIYRIKKDTIELLYFLDNRRLNNSYIVEEEMEVYYVC